MDALTQAQNPALLLSFGKDSLLLLRMALESGFNGPCYYFGETLNQLAQQTIIDNDLTVYSWPATNRYVVPDSNEWAQVDEYLLGDTLLPLISPIVKGEHCQHMKFTERFTRTFHYPHDVTLTGYKRSDQTLGLTFPREIHFGTTRVVNPLYDWTDDQVINALGFTPADRSAIEYCEDCLYTLETMDKTAALARFHSRYSFNLKENCTNAHS